MPAYSDEQLVLEALDDFHPAFGQLVKQYQYSVLRTIASIVSDEQAAQDVAQETFLAAWSDLSKLKEKHKFGRWLNQIAINLSKLWLRDQRKHRENSVSFDEDTVALNHAASYHREKLRQEVWDAIDELADDHREAVTLYYISGYSYKEIGEMLSVPVSTVHGRLQQAKKQLRKEFLDMVSRLQLEIDSTIHKFLKEHAKQNGVSIEGLIIQLIERYKRDMDNPEMAVRRVLDKQGTWANPSPDGRYFSFAEQGSGNLAVRDLTTGEDRNLTDEGNWDGPERFAYGFSVWSPDGKQIAYDWWNEDHYELRIVGLDGSKPRVLYRCENEEIEQVHDWSQDGKFILMGSGKKIAPWTVESLEMALVSVADGSVRILKSIAPSRRRPLMYTCWSLSPDGRYVVYSRPVEEHNGARDIFLLATDGSGEEIPLVEHPADDYGPAWAPDGKTIVFSSDRSGNYDIWLIQVADGKPVGEAQLVKKDTGLILPTGFTREGSLHYYSLSHYYSLGRSTTICTASVDPATGELLVPPTKAIQRFEGHNHSPAWSPDGKSLAYASSRPLPGNARRRPVLVIRSEETGKERELYPEAKIHNLLWSPDGRSILCTQRFQLIDAQTGDVTNIAQLAPTGNISNTAIAWSPDGKTIFCVRRKQGHSSLIAYDLKTGKEKELCRQGEEKVASLTDPVDGQQIPVISWGSLILLSVEGGEARKRELLRPQSKEYFALPVATPDGRYILFCRKKGDQSRTIELCRIPTEGGEPQKLLEMEGLGRISVHPDGKRIAFTRGGSSERCTWAIDNFLPGFTASK